jgi:predicted GH43/DUF377 family glycosyl hydrolase
MTPFGPRKAPTRVKRKQYPTKEEVRATAAEVKKKKNREKWGRIIETKMNSVIQYSAEARQEYPSIVKQCEGAGFQFRWVIPDRLLPGPHHYNPGIIERRDGVWMAYRDQDEFRDSRIGICRLAGDEVLPEENREIKLPDHFGRLEQREDPRLFWFQGEVWMNYVAWDRKRCAAMAIVRLSEDWRVVEELTTTWGDNWSSHVFQKNWAFFERPEGLTMIYYPSPIHEVVTIDVNGHGSGHVRENGIHWPWGLPRGGTSPVLHDGLYWTFFHSRLLNPNARFRYFAGAYAFSAESPYTPKMVTMSPLFAASEEDPNIPTLPLAVFPCGAVFKHGEWWVSCGVNDVRCAIVRINHKDLLRRMAAC